MSYPPNYGPPPGFPPGMPGYSGYGPGSPPPENNMVWAILATLFCCLPFGIVSIVKANQVNTLWAQGQAAAAYASAAEAKKWAMWAAIGGAISWVVSLLILFVLPMIMYATTVSTTP